MGVELGTHFFSFLSMRKKRFEVSCKRSPPAATPPPRICSAPPLKGRQDAHILRVIDKQKLRPLVNQGTQFFDKQQGTVTKGQGPLSKKQGTVTKGNKRMLKKLPFEGSV